jgi:hypothetical protein
MEMLSPISTYGLNVPKKRVKTVGDGQNWRSVKPTQSHKKKILLFQIMVSNNIQVDVGLS